MKRRGQTLVEVLAVMSAVGVVVGSLGVVARLSLQVRRQTTDAIDDLREFDRLAFRFRSDARETVSAELLPGGDAERRPESSPAGDSFTGAGWSLRLADGRSIEYRRNSFGLERRLLDGPRIAHRDRFALDRACDVRLEPFGDASVAGAALRLRARRGPQEDESATDVERLVVEVVWAGGGGRP